jgi:hypothetical protein
VTGDAAGIARDRLARVQAAMARHGVGALLLATPSLGAFASGARRVQVAGGGGGLPWVVVAAGAPSPVVFTTDPDGAPDWMPRAAVEPLRWDRDAALGRLRALVAPTAGAVACDVFSPAVAEAVAALGRPLVDAAPLVAEAVAGKSAREVVLVAGALAAARDALGRAVHAAVPGATPAACVAAFARAMPAHGAGFPLHAGLFWRGGRRLDAGAVLDAGAPLALELGLWARGHAGVAGTTVTPGGGADGARRRRVGEALSALAARCRAGGTTADVRAAAPGVTAYGPLAWGLGVGCEPPVVHLDGDDAAPLHAGTVLVLAPVVDGFRATRALLVRDGAPRWLEPAP